MPSCRCKCGYSCGRKCGLEIMECMERHYSRDCDHDFTGPVEHINHPGGAFSSSVTCIKCGLSAMDHGMRFGP